MPRVSQGLLGYEEEVDAHVNMMVIMREEEDQDSCRDDRESDGLAA